MAYTTINKSTAHFNTKLYTGNGSTNAITGVGHQPDMVWIKSRDATYHHRIYDAVRGVTKVIYPNLTNAEGTSANSLTAFGTDGFTLGSETWENNSGTTFASWNWKANGAGSANTDGSINSTVSVNTTAGFSIVKWTGTGSSGTVGHGLGQTPKISFTKSFIPPLYSYINQMKFKPVPYIKEGFIIKSKYKEYNKWIGKMFPQPHLETPSILCVLNNIPKSSAIATCNSSSIS